MKKILALGGLLLSSSLHADILINEVDADQTSTDTAEFTELYDGGLGNQSLDGLSLVLYNGSGDSSYDAISLDGYSTDADGYFVICGDSNNVANCDLDVSPDSNLIQNGADAVALYNSAASNFPNGTAVTTTDLIDAVVYDTNDSDDSGLLVLLNDSQPQLNEGENGNKDTESNQRCTGGARDTEGFVQAAPTPGAANDCPAVAASFLINEVDADQSSTDTAEFTELYDGGTGNQSLDGYSLVFYNGNGDTSYAAFSLDGYSTDANGFFVLCGDSNNVANCDLDVSPDSNLIQNGADAVALYESAASNFPNGTAVTTTDLVDAVVYDTNDSDDAGLLVLLNDNQPQLNEGENGNKDTESNQRCSGGARDTDGFLQAAPTPGEDNSCDQAADPEFGVCGDSATAISSIQGVITDIDNDVSPLSGTVQVVEAIVTSDRQGGTLANGDSSYEYSGFWLQQTDAETDSDPATSEGVFVYNYSIDVSEGDRVRLMGTVGEYNQVTQISNVTDHIVCSTGNTLPAAIDLTLPVSDLTDWEAVEGMRVTATQELIVSDMYGTGYGFGNYGQFVVSSRLHFQGTEIAEPGSEEALAAEDERTLDALLVDDGVSASYPSFIPFPDDTGFSASNPVRIGYTLPQLEGVMHAYKTNFMVIPDAITIDPTHARTLEPVVDAGANLIIVGMNVLNYFNGDGQGGGFPTSRGAPTVEAFEMQSDKIVDALTAIDADIIGLMEIENDGYGANSAIQTLLDELNAQQTAGMEYSFVNPGVAQIGTDEIAVGLLYRADVVALVGSAVILDSDNSPLDDENVPLFDDSKNRPSLIQTFEFNGQELTISVNHLKSKGSSCGEENEGDDGQGNCNVNRTRAAQALVEFIDEEQLMILGDLNAYSKEDPMQVFYDAGFTNLKYTDASTEDQPYSYSFSGLLGSLDHALATSALADQVLSVDAWHINSVEDSLVDYLTEENGQPYDSVDNYADPDAYRSSDHDPIVVGLLMEEPDSDNDGYTDADEEAAGSNPNDGNSVPADNDGDFVSDVSDKDDDNDGLIELVSLADLSEIRNSLDGASLYDDSKGCPEEGCSGFELSNDLDFDTNGNGSIDAGDDYWNDGMGWEPLGDENNRFTGAFDGNGHTISDLYVDRDSLTGAGLFGITVGATISNVSIVGDQSSVTCYYGCGGLVGAAFQGTEISNSSATASVNSLGDGGRLGMTGGLAGYLNRSSIENSYATGDVSSDTGAYVGGLVGQAEDKSSIKSSYATGAVNTTKAGANGFTGGLVGYSNASSSITSCFATGNVSSDGWNNGGLVGMTNGTITASFASGSVTSGKNAGGLVGFARNATISASYATGALTSTKAGGLVGGNDKSTYNSSYWSTDTTGANRSGGTRYSTNYFGDVEASLACPMAANDAACSEKGTLYVDWETYTDGENTPYWDFGTSSELPGLTIGGTVYRPAN